MCNKEAIQTDQAPAPIGPYSQAVKVGETIYLSGQIPLDPATGELIDGDIDAMSRRIFDSLSAFSCAFISDNSIFMFCYYFHFHIGLLLKN